MKTISIGDVHVENEQEARKGFKGKNQLDAVVDYVKLVSKPYKDGELCNN